MGVVSGVVGTRTLARFVSHSPLHDSTLHGDPLHAVEPAALLAGADALGPFTPVEGSEFLVGLVLVHFFAAVLTAGLTAYAVRYHWATLTGRIFAALNVSLFVWTVGSLARIGTTDPGQYVTITVFKYLGVTTAPVWLLLFAFVYAGSERLVTKGNTAALLAVPVVTLVALASTLDHGLFYAGFLETTAFGTPLLQTERGPVFWGFAVYGWGLIAMGSLLLAYAALRKPRIYRRQSALVLVGLVFAWAVSLLYVFHGWPHAAIDPAPVAFAFASALLAVGVFTFRLVDVAPAAWSRVVDAMDTPVIVLDPHDRIVDLNDAAASLLDGMPIGEDFEGTFPLAARSEALESPADGTVIELETDGERAYYIQRVIPLGSNGRLGRVLVLSDVTEQHRARERIRQRNRDLEQRNEQLDRFASIVSHDLRNPLTVARAYAELVAEDVDDPRLAEVHGAHEKMADLIEDLLTLARTGEVSEVEPVELPEVAHRAWTWVPAGDATFEVVGEPGTLEADEERLAELFENLFINAVQHGGEDVTVRLGSLPGGFYVEDDGPGIPPGEREAIFEYGHSSADDGTGVGLAIVERIVDAHGWTIEVGDAHRGGARFEVTTGATAEDERSAAERAA